MDLILYHADLFCHADLLLCHTDLKDLTDIFISQMVFALQI